MFDATTTLNEIKYHGLVKMIRRTTNIPEMFWLLVIQLIFNNHKEVLFAKNIN